MSSIDSSTPELSSPEPTCAETETSGESRRTILVVDDNTDIVTVIRRILSTQNYDTLVATNGKEALQVAREKKPDVMLLDWMLPEIDGLEVCRQLKADQETRGIMILLVTGRGSIANRVEGFDAGADDYIPKPFNHPELLARIRSALRIKDLTDSLEERNHMLLNSQNELVRSEKMATIGLLAAGIAHEFNNIMAGISGFAQLAKSNDKYMTSLVDVALTQTERAMELTRSLSNHHRNNNVNSDSDVESVTQGTLCLVKKMVEDKGIEVVISVASDTPKAAIQPGQLQELLLNLVINAIHATPKRGRISVIASSVDDGMVRIEVSDTGKGIPPENLGRIFDPFFTTKGALGGGSDQGSGLGLWNCNNIISDLGGRLDVESTPEAGTRFTVLVPEAQESDEEPSGAFIADAIETQPLDRRLRILVVDDEGHIRRMLVEYLSDHEVASCANGESAVLEYRRRPFDYVILDICMQDSIDGMETLSRLKEIDSAAKVIVASGRLRDDLPPEDLQSAHGHLMKPYQLKDLSRLLGLEPPADEAASVTAVASTPAF